MNNQAKIFVLLAALTALLVMAGKALAGPSGMMMALVFAVVGNLSVYWFSDTIVLNMYQAEEIDQSDRTGLYAIVQALVKNADLPMPRVYVVQDDVPNAFATGRSPEHASVAATTGLLKLLSLEEITGVMAHELAHVKHRDTLTGMIAATLAGAISGLANIAMWSAWFSPHHGDREEASYPALGFLWMLLAPLAASLIQMAVSREAEFRADEGGARISGKPLWLASALAKLQAANEQMVSPAMASHPATAHLFIVSPMMPEQVAQWFSTHPPIQKRIERLKQMVS